MNEQSPGQEPNNNNQSAINGSEELSFGYQPGMPRVGENPRTNVNILSAEREQLIEELQTRGHSEELRTRLDDIIQDLLEAQANLVDQEGTTGANQD